MVEGTSPPEYPPHFSVDAGVQRSDMPFSLMRHLDGDIAAGRVESRSLSTP